MTTYGHVLGEGPQVSEIEQPTDEEQASGSDDAMGEDARAKRRRPMVRR